MNKKRFLWTCLFGFLSSCTVGPDPKIPVITMPEKFSEAKKSLGDSSLKNWWHQFQDPYLDMIITEALDNNYDLRIAHEKIREVRSLYRIEKANLMPHFDGTGIVEREKRSQNFFESQFLGPIEKNFFHFGFDASWELDFFGKIRRSKQAVYFDLLSQIENSKDVQITLLSEVAKTYIEVRSLQNRAKVTKKLIDTQNEIVRLTQDKVQAGLMNSIHLEEEISFLKSDEAMLTLLLASTKSASYRLATLLGRQPEHLEEELIKPGPMPVAAGKIPSVLPSELLQRRPDIRKAEKMLGVAIARVGSATADLFPRFSLTGSWGFETDENRYIFQNSSQFWKIGPSFRWPIFYFGQLRSKIKTASSRQKQALLEYEKTIIAALQDVETSLSSYFQEEKRFDALSQEVEATKAITSYQTDRYKSGLDSELEALLAQKKLYQSKRDFLESQETLMSHLIALYKALGGEW